MPYARRRKTGIAKRRYVRKATPKVSKATKTYVKKALTANKEENHAQIRNTTSNISYDSPLLISLSAIAQGNTIETREGDRIQPTRLTMEYIMTPASVAAISRFIIFQWKPDDADDAPSMAKILEITGTGQAPLSPYIQNHTDRSKFKVLADKLWVPNQTTDFLRHGRLSITKFVNKFINYNEGLTTGKSMIYLLGLSNIQSALTEPTLNHIIYLHWKDTA